MQITGCASDKQHMKRANDFQMGNMGHHHGMRNNMKTERKMDAPVSIQLISKLRKAYKRFKRFKFIFMCIK